MLRFSLCLLTISALSCLADPHWEIQYRYRQVDSTLTINDFAFPSAKRGIVCGFTTDRADRSHPLVLVTSDSGANWAEVPGKEPCVSLAFLDDSTGWMVTDKGLWKTTESGRTWVKLKNAPSAMLRVHFFDQNRGVLAGREKRVFQTTNGGETWTPLDVLKQVQGDPLYTTFGTVAFNGPRGMIAGWNIPPVRGEPAWMTPDRKPSRGRQVPHYSVLLTTTDSGAHWQSGEASIFGQITRVSLGPRFGLGLIEFRDEFEYPSEVNKVDQRTGSSENIYREKNRAITDVNLLPSGNALIAGYETTGSVFRSPIPGRLKILSSSDLKHWTEMEVDYRAVARSAIIAAPDEDNVWVATDTGMILKLVNN